jgi:hypothetical protein
LEWIKREEGSRCSAVGGKGVRTTVRPRHLREEGEDDNRRLGLHSKGYGPGGDGPERGEGAGPPDRREGKEG